MKSKSCKRIKSKSFNNYSDACKFRDKVDGQTQWCSHKGTQYWIVWY